MKNLFNHNKKASKDYTFSMLPQTRREVFFDVLKLNWKSFLLFGLLFLLFSFPLQLVTLSESMSAVNLSYSDYSKEQIPYMITMMRVIASVIKVPCFFLLAVAISGFSRVIRQYAWMENVNFAYEFKQGIKNNIGQTALLFALIAVSNIVATIFISMAEAASDFLSSIVVLVPAALIILCLLPVFAYMVVSISIYNSRFGSHFHVGRILYSNALWKTLLALLCCVAPFVLQVIPIFICQLVGAVLSPLLSPVVFLGWYLFALNGLDEHINRQNYPSLVGKGLYSSQSLQ